MLPLKRCRAKAGMPSRSSSLRKPIVGLITNDHGQVEVCGRISRIAMAGCDFTSGKAKAHAWRCRDGRDRPSSWLRIRSALSGVPLKKNEERKRGELGTFDRLVQDYFSSADFSAHDRWNAAELSPVSSSACCAMKRSDSSACQPDDAAACANDYGQASGDARRGERFT